MASASEWGEDLSARKCSLGQQNSRGSQFAFDENAQVMPVEWALLDGLGTKFEMEFKLTNSADKSMACKSVRNRVAGNQIRLFVCLYLYHRYL
jgi:hypothetical protein